MNVLVGMLRLLAALVAVVVAAVLVPEVDGWLAECEDARRERVLAARWKAQR